LKEDLKSRNLGSLKSKCEKKIIYFSIKTKSLGKNKRYKFSRVASKENYRPNKNSM